MAFNQRLKALRLKNDESLQQVADAVSASKAHIWELERGTSKNPSLDLLQRLAEHFKVTVGYFVEAEPLGDAKAQRFYRKHEAKLKTMTDADLAVLDSLVERLSKRDDE